METKKALTPDMPARYSVRLQGRVSADWSDWLDDADIVFEGEGHGAVTIVTGTVRDQSALFGLLTFVRDLGVPLIAVAATQWPADAPDNIHTMQRRNAMKANLIRLICNAVALGMGVVVIVINILGNLTTGAAFSMLGIGLAVLGLAGLQKE